MMRKFLKRAGLGLLILIFLVLMTGFIFVSTSEQFGGTASEDRLERYKRSPNFQDGRFVNDGPFNMEMDCHSIEKMIHEMWTPDPRVAPTQNLEVEVMDSLDIVNHSDTLTRVTWLGHSTVLLEIDGIRILFDPVFGQYAAPHHWLGRKRYNDQMPIEIENLPPIDAVIISHDHYDHLDYASIVKLASKTDRFYVPLGVGNHLARWGVSWDDIQEMDWWEESYLEDLLIACTPSRHMSGRGFSDQFSTLWGSWVIKGRKHNVYFSGDGGYGSRFENIREKYGPFDIALLECGQYNALWADVHMMPEQTAQAGIDLKARYILPIHWGAFTLATHSWTDPIERVTAAAENLKIPIYTPRMGESITLGDMGFVNKNWWEDYD